MSSKKKIVAVSYAMGRTGSSLLMGILKLIGLMVKDTKKPNKFNPQGYFEYKRHVDLLKDVYKPIWKMTLPPKLKEVDRLASGGISKYEIFLGKEFKDSDNIAFKAYRMLDIPILWRLKDKYDIKAIVLNRNTRDQAASSAKMNKRSIEEYLERIRAWKGFRDEVIQRYPFNYLHVDCYSLIDLPFLTVKRISEFLGKNEPPMLPVLGFIKKGNMHR